MRAGKTEIQWELIKAKRQFWIFPVGVFLFVIVTFFLLVIPRVNNLLSLREEVVDLQDEEAVLAEKRNQLESISTVTLQGQIDLVQSVLPNEKPFLQTLLTMRQYAEESNVLITAFEFDPGLVASDAANLTEAEAEEVESGLLTFVALETSVRGAFAEINNFLERIEQMKPLVRVIEAEFEDTGEDVQEAPIVFGIYYSLPPSEIGAVSSEFPILSPEELDILARIREYETVELPSPTLSPQTNIRDNPFAF